MDKYNIKLAETVVVERFKKYGTQTEGDTRKINKGDEIEVGIKLYT